MLMICSSCDEIARFRPRKARNLAISNPSLIEKSTPNQAATRSTTNVNVNNVNRKHLPISEFHSTILSSPVRHQQPCLFECWRGRSTATQGTCSCSRKMGGKYVVLQDQGVRRGRMRWASASDSRTLSSARQRRNSGGHVPRRCAPLGYVLWSLRRRPDDAMALSIELQKAAIDARECERPPCCLSQREPAHWCRHGINRQVAETRVPTGQKTHCWRKKVATILNNHLRLG
jgi:hypothetical protein